MTIVDIFGNKAQEVRSPYDMITLSEFCASPTISSE